MKHSHRYEFGRVILSPLEKEDIEALRVLRNRESAYFNTKKEITREEQIKWYDAYLMKTDDIMFKITHKESPEEFIGAIAVYNIDYANRTAEVGRTVIDKNKNSESGLGLEATKGICLFAFTVLGMKKIVASILKSNERILKVDTKAGFYLKGNSDDGISYLIEMTTNSINIF